MSPAPAAGRLPIAADGVHIGTSGWNYDRWRTCFYADVPRRDWLRHAARRFTGIEVNATFYRLQTRETFRRWRDETPVGFRFAVKANRYLTHRRKLLDPQPAIQLERDRAGALGAKLAVVLWQLPPGFGRDTVRLAAFLRALDGWPSTRHAIEFRHPSWFAEDIADSLRAHHVAVCQSDAADWPLWDAVTTDLVYVRLHGHTVTYVSGYTPEELRTWAGRIRRWRREGRTVHVYFDNDAAGRAPFDAQELLRRVRRATAAPCSRAAAGRDRVARYAGRSLRARARSEASA